MTPSASPPSPPAPERDDTEALLGAIAMVVVSVACAFLMPLIPAVVVAIGLPRLHRWAFPLHRGDA